MLTNLVQRFKPAAWKEVLRSVTALQRRIRVVSGFHDATYRNTIQNSQKKAWGIGWVTDNFSLIGHQKLHSKENAAAAVWDSTF